MQKTKREPAKAKRERTPGSATQASLHVWLWVEDEESIGTAGALAMVEDFLGVSPCETKGAVGDSASGCFADVVQAINAGRRLQRLVRGYSSATNGKLGAGILLTNGDVSVSEAEMKALCGTQALSRAQPAQLFVVGGLCDTVKSIPGLRFKEVEAAFLNGSVAKRPRAMYVLPVEAFTPESSGDGEMKTQVVEVFKHPASVPEQNGGNPAPLVLAPIGARSSDSVAARPGLPASVEVPGIAARAEAAWAAAAFHALIVKLWVRPVVRWASGAGAVLVVAAALAMGMHGKDSAKPVDRAQGAAGPESSAPPRGLPSGGTPGAPGITPAKVVEVAKTKPKPEAGAGVKPPPAVNPVAVPAGPPVVAQQSVQPAPKVEEAKREPEKQVPPPAPAGVPAMSETKHGSSGGVSVSYSPEQLNMLLDEAEKDSGDGNYDKAILKYDAILKHDPGNQRAKQGRERAIRNKNNE
jgi:hypothetical protein